MKKIANFGRTHSEVVTLKVLPKSAWGTARKKIKIYYSNIHTPVGKMIAGVAYDGICFLGCGEDTDLIMNDLQKRYPYAEIKKRRLLPHRHLQDFFNHSWKRDTSIKLCVKCTDFQAQVWRALLDIPIGKVCTYAELAEKIGRPKIARAVGKVVAQNPIAYVIPCHRVVCTNGKMGGYYWGIAEKLKFLKFESASGKKIKGYANWEPTLF